MLDQRLSVAIVSGPVGKTPNNVTHSFVFDEAYELAKRGLDVHVVKRVREKDEVSCGIHFHGLNDELRLSVIPLIFRHWRILMLRRLLMHPKTIPRIVREDSPYFLYGLNVSRVVKANNIDLIHAHFASPEGFAGLLAKEKTGKPLVVSLRGYDILTEHSVNYGKRIRKRFRRRLQSVLRGADVLITASSATYAEALRAGADKRRLRLIPNGVDVTRFRPDVETDHIRQKLGIEGKTMILTVTRHQPVKGIEYLITAAARVIKQRKDVVFVIGGDGRLRPFHEDLVRRLGLRKQVVFTGWIPRDEMPMYCATCDIFVVPSLQEAFGNVVSEAMACSKPVIGTKVGGIPDQITDGVNGILVPPKDPDAIADAIQYLIDDPSKMKKMGEKGRSTVETNFNLAKKIDRMIDLYKQLTN